MLLLAVSFCLRGSVVGLVVVTVVVVVVVVIGVVVGVVVWDVIVGGCGDEVTTLEGGGGGELGSPVLTAVGTSSVVTCSPGLWKTAMEDNKPRNRASTPGGPNNTPLYMITHTDTTHTLLEQPHLVNMAHTCILKPMEDYNIIRQCLLFLLPWTAADF